MSEWIRQVSQDASLTVRNFLRHPGFTFAVVATLSVGIGSTVAIASVADAALLRPLPYPDPHRLYALTPLTGSGDASYTSPLEITELERRTTSFSGMAAVANSTGSLTGDGPPVSLRAQYLFGPLFDVLGVGPVRGRGFEQDDHLEAAEPVVVISDGFWRTRFASDPDVVGRTVTVDGRPARVVGVMPPGFGFGDYDADLWLPLQFGLEFPGRVLPLAVVRLAEGVEPEVAGSDVDRALAAMATDLPDAFIDPAAELVPLRARLVGEARPILIALAGAVALLLVIACANVANLLLTRAIRRRRAFAVRISLGASRGRLVRQLLAESATLSLAGAVGGMLIATAIVKLVVARLPDSVALPRVGEVAVDLRVVAVALGVTVLTMLLFGLAPAVMATRLEDTGALLREGRGSTGTAATGRARGALVVGQIALVSLLLVAAGLLGRSFLHLTAVDLGLDTRGVIATELTMTADGPAEPERVRGYFQNALEEVRSIPGVAAAGMVQHLPLTGVRSTTGWSPKGTEEIAGPVDLRVADPGFFDAAGTRILAGRGFRSADGADAPNVFLINRALARRLGGEAAIGERIQYHWGSRVEGRVVPVYIAGEIIGIVEDVRESGPAHDPAPALYRPFGQDPWVQMNLVVRTAGDPDAVAAVVESRLQALQVDRPVEVQPMADRAATLLARPRLQLLLIGAFAVFALLLAAVGLYGVIAYAVEQRRGEMAVRLAMGATPAAVTGLVLRQALLYASAGLGVGAAVALVGLPLLQSLVYGVSVTDPVTIGGVIAFLTLVTLAAAAWPARRAAALEPMDALRVD